MRSPNQTIWTRPYLCDITSAQPSSFELIARELRLTPAQYESSAALKEWVRKNKNQKYGPPDLLEQWGMTVDTHLTW